MYHTYLSIIAIVSSLTITGLTLAYVTCYQKRPFVSQDIGRVYLFTDAIFNAESSRHVIDFFTIQHIQHGIANFLLISILPIAKLGLSNNPNDSNNPNIVSVDLSVLEIASISLIIACIWEVIENTPCFFKVFNTTGAPEEYTGDTVINIISDITFCTSATIICTFVPFYWNMIALIALELISIVIGRESLTLLVLGIFSKSLKEWQRKFEPRPVRFFAQLYPVFNLCEYAVLDTSIGAEPNEGTNLNLYNRTNF